MRFYTQQHQYTCGIDLHARMLYVCILNAVGEIVVHRKVGAQPEALRAVLRPYEGDLVVGVECMFTWYWLADLCGATNIAFVLGHALAMRAIHGAKKKNDRVDSEKIARLLRGGMFPMAYVYPQAKRATRDLMRRRTHFVRKRAELLAHIQNTNHQYNLSPLGRMAYPANREGVTDHFPDPMVQQSIAADITLIERYDAVITDLEKSILRAARSADPQTLLQLRSIPGVGPILSLVLLYEIDDISRFPDDGSFLSYARLVRCEKSSNGKVVGHGSAKMGNAHLRWAFAEIAQLHLKNSAGAKTLKARLEKKHGPGKALAIISRKLGSAVYYMLKKQEAFDAQKFLRS